MYKFFEFPADIFAAMWKKNWLFAFIGWILRDVLRYRTNITLDNIQNSFPHETHQTQQSIYKTFYVFIGKVLIELIRGVTHSVLKRRYTFHESPELKQAYESKTNALITMAHIGNWEIVGSGIGAYYPGHVVCFYRRIKNQFLDRVQKNRRIQYLKHLLESRQVSDLIRILRNENVFLLQIIDQNPGSDQGLLWVSFLNRPTAFSNASETLALRYKMPVFYAYVEILPNGDYEVFPRMIWDGRTPVEDGYITTQFARHLESNIRAFPYAWLWTHRRWKRTPPPSEFVV